MSLGLGIWLGRVFCIRCGLVQRDRLGCGCARCGWMYAWTVTI